MSRGYTLGLLLGLCKAAEDDEANFEGDDPGDLREAILPRHPKHPSKFIKSPRQLSVRKRRRFVRQMKLPKPLLSA